jgi:hypothetical protein
MWQNLIIAVIVLACAFLIGRRFFRQFKGLSGSGCGCCSGGGCSSARSIADQRAEPQRSSCGCEKQS